MPPGTEVTVPLPSPAFVTCRVYCFKVKVAVTLVAAVMVTVQVPVPVQPAPLQPVKVDVASGVAVRVTLVLSRRLSEQVAPHARPPVDEVTVPVPVPARTTVSVCCVGWKVAVTVVAALMVTTQLPVPEQPPPLQPVNVEPGLVVAVNTTTLPWSTAAAQVAPQVMPAGADVTVPVPMPAFTTVRVRVMGAKVATTVRALAIVTVQVPVPGQLMPGPLQPVKVEPALGVAVSTTELPWSKSARHVAPQVMPAGADVTVPLPPPAFTSVTA